MKKKILELLAIGTIFVLGSLGATAGVILPDLDPVAADTTGTSPSFQPPASRILFNNLISSAVDVYWIDPSGNRILYRSNLLSGQSFIQGTFVDDLWLIVLNGTGGTTTQGTGTLWTAFRAQSTIAWTSADYDTANIREKTVPEPASLALLGLGLAGIAYQRRKRSA